MKKFKKLLTYFIKLLSTKWVYLFNVIKPIKNIYLRSFFKLKYNLVANTNLAVLTKIHISTVITHHSHFVLLDKCIIIRILIR